MSELKVNDLMLSLYECATVLESATLYEAVVAMEATRKMYQRWDYRPRIALVHDAKQLIVGTVRHYDILRAMEPKYKEFGDLPLPVASGLNKEFLNSTYERYQMWNVPLVDLCRKVSHLTIKDVMRIPSETEYIDSEALLGRAIHRMLMGNHPSLLVTDAKGVVGILRLSDVAGYVVSEIKKSGETLDSK